MSCEFKLHWKSKLSLSNNNEKPGKSYRFLSEYIRLFLKWGSAVSVLKIRLVCLNIGPCSQTAAFWSWVFKLSPFEWIKEQIRMTNNSNASVLSFEISLLLFSVYGCLFNCIYQMDNFSYCQENNWL